MKIKHDWAKESDGSIDIWQLDQDYHNGPRCVRCNFFFCEHCSPEDFDSDCDEQTPYLF